MAKSSRIERLSALEVLDSRGDPTVEVEVRLSDGASGRAMVPSGASTGRHEARELRDGEKGRYDGRSVSKAVSNVNKILASKLHAFPAEPQADLDERLIELDGSSDKSRLGANAILGVSMAVARAVAESRGIPLWEHLCVQRVARMPVPMINILSGGLHAGRQIEFQDFLIVPHGFGSFAESLEAAVKVHRRMERLLRDEGLVLTGVADEGGWGPALPSHTAALEHLMRAIQAAGYEPGKQISLAIDVAASHFESNGLYQLRSEGKTLTAAEMIERLREWIERYPLLSIEDPLAEDDWDGWRELTRQLGKRCLLVGDDLFVTHPARLQRGIGLGAANAVLIKMNQIGTLTETLHVIDQARQAGYAAVISARSGETEDSFLADLAVASGAGQIKIGSVTRSERLAKYNQLLRIEAASSGGKGKPEPFHEVSRWLFSEYWKS